MSDTTTQKWFELWKERKREEGRKLGKTPCLHPAHYHAERNPDMIYSSPHLHWDFGDCDGWVEVSDE